MSLPGTMIEFIATQDHRLLRRVQSWRLPRWVRLWMVCATRGGDGWAWYAQGLVILTWGGARRFTAVGAAGLAAGTGIALFLALKKTIGRKRPSSPQLGNWSKLLPPDQFSFPSGHSITAFAITLPVILSYPSLAGGLLVLAVSIAASRVVLGMHFLSDVVAGCLIGSGLGYLFFVLLT